MQERRSLFESIIKLKFYLLVKYTVKPWNKRRIAFNR